MAFRAAIQYIGHFVMRELGLATYVPTSVAANSTSMRVLDIGMFDPAGGQVVVEDNDNLITWSAINGDQLTGIPGSGTGSISATINPVTNGSRDILIFQNVISTYEVERYIDRFRFWYDSKSALPDVEKKRYSAARGWFDTGVSLRDDSDGSFGSVVANTVDYENGTWEFTSAQTYTELYVAGWAYNPFYTIAAILEMLRSDMRYLTYLQAGQTAQTKPPLGETLAYWRARAEQVMTSWKARGFQLDKPPIDS